MDGIEVKGMRNPPLKTQKYLMPSQICLRFLAIVATLAATTVMFTSKQSVFIYGLHVDARYSYSSAFKFFAYANLIACGFSVVSMFYAFILTRRGSESANYFYMFLHDLVMMTLLIAACAAATAIGYVGKYGNSHSGWIAICDNFAKYCDKVTISVMLSYVAFVFYLFLTIISATMSRNIQV